MNPRSNVKQALANLSGKPVNDISMARLAPMFASQVLKRREAELQAEREAEDFVHPSFVDALRAKTAKLLDAEAENTASGLPVSSVYDALQITKRHKQAKTDAGIRALNGMLTTMWKASREGDIDAEAFMKYREYFGANFPKSAVADVFEEIGAQGYAALPVSDLLVIASRIYSQADYDYEVQCAGLTTKQPHHVKARRFILAVINEDEETEHPFDQRHAQGMFDEDPFAQLNEEALNSGLPEGDVRGLSQWIEDGRAMLDAGNIKGAEAALYEIRNRLDELDEEEFGNNGEPLVSLEDQIDEAEYRLRDARRRRAQHNTLFDNEAEQVINMIDEDSALWDLAAQRADVAKAHAIFPEAKGEWAEDFKDTFSEIVEAYTQFDYELSDEVWWEVAKYFLEERGVDVEGGKRDLDIIDMSDPAWREGRHQAQDTQMLSWDDEYAISEEELEELGQWHSSMGDPIYQLSSHLMGGHDVPLEVGEAALQELEKSWTIVQHEGREDENQDLAGLIDSLHYWIKPY